VPAGGNGFTAARTATTAAHSHWAQIALADLCANGADVNAEQRGGSSVLHGAVACRDAQLVRLAVRKGAAVDAVDAEGRTAAALAAELEWAEGAALLANHASLPRDNRSSRFALDAARQPIERPDLSDVPRALQSKVTGNSHFRLAKVRELVTPDPRLVFSISNDDELAIEASAHIGHEDLMRFHLDHGAPLSLPTAVSLGDLDAVRFWLDRDATLLHERGAHDFPVMFFCVFGGGSVEMAELLVARGAAVDQDSVGTTALHWCVRRDERDLAVWLLEHGADPEPVGHLWSRDGETPLQVAVAGDRPGMAALLRDRGARR
jgi:ankyrin repeat protein